MKLFTKNMGTAKEFSRINKNNMLSLDELLKIRGGNSDDEGGTIKK